MLVFSVLSCGGFSCSPRSVFIEVNPASADEDQRRDRSAAWVRYLLRSAYRLMLKNEVTMSSDS